MTARRRFGKKLGARLWLVACVGLRQHNKGLYVRTCWATTSWLPHHKSTTLGDYNAMKPQRLSQPNQIAKPLCAGMQGQSQRNSDANDVLEDADIH